MWERDASGTFVASSYAYLNARDLGRVGLLMQRDGRWGERQLLPPSWVAFNRTPFANYRPDPQKPGEAVPGGQWWLNATLEGSARPWPDVPDDAFAALGHWGRGFTCCRRRNWWWCAMPMTATAATATTNCSSAC